jgi:hypothetical protein
MNRRRKALKLLLGGIAACVSMPAVAALEIDVYHSPD